MICPDCNQQIMPFGCGCSEIDKNNQLKLHNAELIAENKKLVEENQQLKAALNIDRETLKKIFTKEHSRWKDGTYRRIYYDRITGAEQILKYIRERLIKNNTK